MSQDKPKVPQGQGQSLSQRVEHATGQMAAFKSVSGGKSAITSMHVSVKFKSKK